MNNAVFDAITNSEDEMIRRAKIDKKQACIYLRAYIIIRLLFFDEFVISDSSINLNRALRTLISAKEGGSENYDLKKLPQADFGELLESGLIRLAARDIYKGNFSERLRIAQDDKEYVDKPGAEYTEIIDGLCKEEKIYWWSAEEISKTFTMNIRDALKREYSDSINLFLKDLSNRLSDREILTYNIVKREVLKKYKETSDEYQIVHTMLRESYDYNIPEKLGLNYFRFFDSPLTLAGKSDFEINLTEQYECSWKYLFNTYAFALLPVYDLKYLRGCKQGILYKRALSQYMVEGSGSFQSFLAALEDYLKEINYVLVHTYNNKYIGNQPENIVARFREYKDSEGLAGIGTEMVLKGFDIAGAIPEIVINPFIGILKLFISNFLPSMIKKGHEARVAMPEIKQAIIRVDK